MKKVKMALIYDFDKTLSPKDMQEFHLLKRLGYENPADFWGKCQELSKKCNMDGILAYMYLAAIENPEMTRESLVEEGSYIKLFKGVDTWFDRINAYGLEHNIEIEHYIISSGIKEMIEGTPIASKFKQIYACSYYYGEDGKAKWPSRVINYTTKTQYLFRINKGVLDETNDFDLNKSTPDQEKYIPLNRMVYFGDGLTDVPSMKVVGDNGGNTIAVFRDSNRDKGPRELARELYKDKRATFMAKADYSEGSRIDQIIKGIIDKTEADSKLDDYR